VNEKAEGQWRERAQPDLEPEKKRKGRAPSEGEPLRRVLIFLGTKEIDALKALVGARGMSTKNLRQRTVDICVIRSLHFETRLYEFWGRFVDGRGHAIFRRR